MKKTKSIAFFISLFLIFFVFLFCKQDCFAASELKDSSGKTITVKTNGVIYSLYDNETALASAYKGENDIPISLAEYVTYKGRNYRVRGIADYGLYWEKEGTLLRSPIIYMYFCDDLYIGSHAFSHYGVLKFYGGSGWFDLTDQVSIVIENLCETSINQNSSMCLKTGWFAYAGTDNRGSKYFKKFYARIAEQYYSLVWKDIEIFKEYDVDSYVPYKDLFSKNNCTNMEQYLSSITDNTTTSGSRYNSKSNKNSDNTANITKTSWWLSDERMRAKTEIDCSVNVEQKTNFDFLIVVDVTSSMFYSGSNSDRFSKDVIAYGQTVQLVNKLAKDTNNRVAVLTFSNGDNVSNSITDSKAIGNNSTFKNDAGFLTVNEGNYAAFKRRFRDYYPKYVDAGTDYAATMKKVYSEYFAQRKDKSRTPVVVFISDGWPESAGYSSFNTYDNSIEGLTEIGTDLKNKGVVVKGISVSSTVAERYIAALTTNGKFDVFAGNNENELVRAFQSLASSMSGYVNISDKVNTDIFNIEGVYYETVDGSCKGVLSSKKDNINLSLPLSDTNGKTIKIIIDLSLKDHTYCSSSINTNSDDAVIRYESTEASVSSPVLDRYGLRVLKTDDEDVALKDAVFSLRDSKNNLIRLEPVDGHEGDYLYCGVSADSNKAKTNSNGYINIYGLPAEPYKIHEESAPAEFVIVQPTTDVSGNVFSIDNAIPQFTIKNNIASHIMYVEKSFKIGTLSEDEVKKFVEDITIEINGTKINGKTSKLNYKLSSFPYVISGTGSERYVRFYNHLKLKSGSYAVTEVLGPISSSYFDKNNIKSLSNTSYFLDIVNANNSDTVRCELDRTRPMQYVFFVNNCKTGEITIEKTASVDASWDKEKFASVLYDTSFNISGKTLIGEDYNKTITIDESNIDSWEFVKNNDKLCLRYTLTGVPYSGSSGYVVKEIPNAKTDSSKTLTYSSFYKMGREDGVLSSNKTLKISNVYQEGSVCFANTLVSNFKVRKRSADNIIAGFEFTLTGNGGDFVYHATTDSNGFAEFKNVQIYDENGSQIEYVLKEKVPKRYDSSKVTFSASSRDLSLYEYDKDSASCIVTSCLSLMESETEADVEVYNPLRTDTLLIDKKYNGEKNLDKISDIEFILYQYDYKGTLIDSSDRADTKLPTDIFTDSYGQAIIENLLVYDSSDRYYQYKVVEAPEFSKKYANVEYSTNPNRVNGSNKTHLSATSQGTTIYVNNVTSSNIIIEKKDADNGKYLEGATFRVIDKNNPTLPIFFSKNANGGYKYNAYSSGTPDIKTPSSGKIMLTDMPAGNYTITEISAPSNYEISGDSSKEIVVEDIGQTVTFYDKLKTKKIRIAKFAEDCVRTDNTQNLNGTKFTITGTSYNGSEYFETLTIDNSWSRRSGKISYNYPRIVYYVCKEVEIPYGSYKIEEIKSPARYDLSKTLVRKLDNVLTSWSSDNLFLEENNSTFLNCNVDESTGKNDFYLFYNKLKDTPINIYKVVIANTKEEALSIAQGTTFRVQGIKAVPSITVVEDGEVKLNTAAGWQESSEEINGVTNYYCFKYTTNIPYKDSVTIKENPGPYCDSSFVQSSSYPSIANAELGLSRVLNLSENTDSVYFFNSHKTQLLTMTKAIDVPNHEGMTEEEIAAYMVNELSGINLHLSGKTSYGKEISKVFSFKNPFDKDSWGNDERWKLKNNGSLYYLYCKINYNGFDFPVGEYTVTEIFSNDTEYSKEQTLVKSDFSEEDINSENFYSDLSSYSNGTSTSFELNSDKVISFYNKKDMVNIHLRKYTDAIRVTNDLSAYTIDDMISYLSGTKIRISGTTVNGYDYEQDIVINDENKSMFSLGVGNPGGRLQGHYLTWNISIPRGTYTITEIESPNYDLSKTQYYFTKQSIEDNASNLPTGVSVVNSNTITLNLANTANINYSDFYCGFLNKVEKTNIRIYKTSKYASSGMSDEEIKEFFKGLAFNVSCKNTFGTTNFYIPTSNSNWKIERQGNYAYIYFDQSVPLGECTVTEDLRDYSIHPYFDLSKVTVSNSNVFSDELLDELFEKTDYSTTITQTIDDVNETKNFCFANTLKTEKIKINLLGDGAHDMTSAKELLDNSEFIITCNSNIANIDLPSQKIVLDLDDTENTSFDIVTNNGTDYAMLFSKEIEVPVGQYTVEEVSSSNIYNLSRTLHSSDVSNVFPSSENAIIGASYTKDIPNSDGNDFYFYNQYSFGDIEIEKVDADTNAKLPGVEFRLTDSSFSVFKFVEADDSTPELPIYVVDNENGTECLKTGTAGKFIIRDMLYGDYYLQETATLDSYEKLDQFINIPLSEKKYIRTIENSLKTGTIHIVKAAEDIDKNTDDINSVLNGLVFTISGTQENGVEYNKTIVVDEDTPFIKRAIDESDNVITDSEGRVPIQDLNGPFYACLDIDVPVGEYTITEDASAVSKYDSSKVCISDSVEGIFDSSVRTLGNTMSVSVTNSSEDSKSEVYACFYNPLAYGKLTIYKYIPNATSNIVAKNLIAGTKFIITGITDPSYKKEYVISATGNTWTFAGSYTDSNGVTYRGYRISDYIVLPFGEYKVEEAQSDVFDNSKTQVGWSIANALSSEPNTSLNLTISNTTTSHARVFVNYVDTKTIRLGKVANNTYANMSDAAVHKYLDGLQFTFSDMVFGSNGYNETVTIDDTWTVGATNGYKYLYKDIEVPVSKYIVTESVGSNIYFDASLENTYNAPYFGAVLSEGSRSKSNTAYFKVSDTNKKLFFFNTAKDSQYVIYKAVKGNISKDAMLELVKGTKFVVTSNKNSDPSFEPFTITVGEDAYNTADEYGIKWNYGQKTSTVDNELYSLMSYRIALPAGVYNIKEIPNSNFDASKIYASTVLDSAVSNQASGTSSDSHSQFVFKPYVADKPEIHTSMFINTINTSTIRISKFADNLKSTLTDAQIYTYLNGIQFNIKDALVGESVYNTTVTIDDTWSVGVSGDYKYLYKDFEVPISKYSVTELIDLSKNAYYDASKIYTASSLADIVDTEKRELKATNEVNILNGGDGNAYFFNTQKSEGLAICKYVPGITSRDKMFSFVDGTKFVITGVTDPSFRKEIVVDASDKSGWSCYTEKSSSTGIVYYAMKASSPIKLPTGKYNIEEIPNDNTDASKTNVGWSLSHAETIVGTSYPLTVKAVEKEVSAPYARCFINYPATKTVRLAKIADNTFDSVSDSAVRRYLAGIEFKFEDVIFGKKGYNETVVIDSSWKLGNSNGYKYLYKDIEVPASNYNITESVGSNIYFDAKTSKTYNEKSISNVLDISKRIEGKTAKLNVLENDKEVYFFNTAKPSNFVLCKAIKGDVSKDGMIKLLAGTKFILTNKTDGSTATIVVPETYDTVDEHGGKWSYFKKTLDTGEAYSLVKYTISTLTPGEYEIKEIPNGNFDPLQIYTGTVLANANENRINGISSDTYEFSLHKPHIESADIVASVFINTLGTKTIRIAKLANNTFNTVPTGTVRGYLNGLEFKIQNTLISDEEFSKTITIDSTWSTATNGDYRYLYKDVEVPSGIYTVTESIGANTYFDAELTETYYQTSVENVLNEEKRQQGTTGAVTTSNDSNKIYFFNTVTPINTNLYKAVKGSLTKAEMLDLMKGTKFMFTNSVNSMNFVITVGEDAFNTPDEFGRKWKFFTKEASDGNIYSLMLYNIYNIEPGKYTVKEIPNDNFDPEKIQVSTSLDKALASEYSDSVTGTRHIPGGTYIDVFVNTLDTKTLRVAKLADNIYNTTTDADVRKYLNGLQFTIKDNYLEDAGYSTTLTIDDTWSIVKDDTNKVKYVYKDIEVPVSSYTVTESVGTNTVYDLTKTYNQKTLLNVLDTTKRTSGSEIILNLANNEKEAYFYNSSKPGKFIINKLVEGVKDEAELRRLLNGTKFILTNTRTNEEIVYTIDSTWSFRTNTSSTGASYGSLYKTLELDANKYTLKEVANSNFEQDQIRIDWSIDRAEAASYGDTVTFTIVNPTSTLARYFINTHKTGSIKLVKVADVTTSNITDANVHKLLDGLNINVKSLNSDKTYIIDDTWTVGSANGYKYLYKEISVPYGTYTVTETTGTNKNFNMSEVYNAASLASVLNSASRTKGSSFKVIVDGSEEACVYNTVKPVNIKLTKIMDHTTSAYIRQVANGTKFTIVGTDLVGRAVDKTFTIDNSWNYDAYTHNSVKYSYLYMNISILPGSYVVTEIPNENCDGDKVTVSWDIGSAVTSTNYKKSLSLNATSNTTVYTRAFYNHIKESTVTLSKLANNVSSTMSSSEVHALLDGLQFEIKGKTILGHEYSKTITINSDWSLGKNGDFGKLSYDIVLPYGDYNITELSGNNTRYNLNKTVYAYSDSGILDPSVYKKGTTASLAVSEPKHSCLFFNSLKEKPEYSVTNTSASTPGSDLTGIIETTVINGSVETPGEDIPVVVILRDKDGNEEIIQTTTVDLDAGESQDLTFSVTYPDDLVPEEYEIEVRINWEDKDDEQNPDNNNDFALINPYDFAMNKVGLKDDEGPIGGYVSLVPEITYSGSKPFTNNDASVQFFVLATDGTPVTATPVLEVKLNTIDSFVDENGNLNIAPNSTWAIGSDESPLKLKLPVELVSGTEYQILARVNWDDRFSELNPNNNKKQEGIVATNSLDIKIEPVYPNSSYYVGTDIISTYIVDNTSNNIDIIPGQLNVDFSVNAKLPTGEVKSIPVSGSASISKENIVPKNSTSIVYFRWNLPKEIDGASLVNATISCSATLNLTSYTDANPANDTAVITKKAYKFQESHVEDTNYEEDADAAMNALNSADSALGVSITNFVTKAINTMNNFNKVTTNQSEDSTVFEYKNISTWEEWRYNPLFGFYKYHCSVDLSNSLDLQADEHYMTDDYSGSPSGELKHFKSGYGFTVDAKSNYRKYTLTPPSDSITDVQYSACFFPEHMFSEEMGKYETLVYNTTKNAFNIVNEKYSNNLHYTPIWYPDIESGSSGNYPVAVEFTQCWTPAGVISSRQTDNSIKIEGNIYEDWYQQQH